MTRKRGKMTNIKKLQITLLACLFFLFNFSFSFGADWPNFRGDTQATGRSSNPIQMPLVLKWFSAGHTTEENGLIASESSVYQASVSGGIAAYDFVTGAQIAVYPNIYLKNSTPAISGEQIYGLHIDSLYKPYTYCMDRTTGLILWSYPMPGTISNSSEFMGPVCDKKYVYVYLPSTTTNGIWVFDKETGSIKTGFPALLPVPFNPNTPGINVDNERIFIYRINDAQLHGFASDGSILPGFPISLPALSGNYYNRAIPSIRNNKVYVYARSDAATNLNIYAYDIATGLSLSGFPVSAGQINSGYYSAYGGMCIYDNYIYALDGLSNLYSFDTNTGAPQPGFPVKLGVTVDAVYSCPSVSDNNIVFVNAGRSKKIYAVGGAGRADAGTILWQYTLTSGDFQGFDMISPVISGSCLLDSVDGNGIYEFGPPLTIYKTADKLNANYGDTISYTITLNSTNSPGPCTNVVIADTLPSGVDYVAGSATGPASISSGIITWNAGTIVPDTITSYTFQAVVSQCASNITNTAAVYCSEYPASITNDIITSISGTCGTPTDTVTASNTCTPSRTPTNTPSGTLTSTASFSPTSTVTSTPSPTSTPSRTPPPTFTSTATATITATKTQTPTATPTPKPLHLTLKNNFPNPFKDDTNIVYHLTVDADVTIKIFTISGEIVLAQKGIKGMSGYNNFYWAGRNTKNEGVASGVFIYKITAGTNRGEYESATSKLACVK